MNVFINDDIIDGYEVVVFFWLNKLIIIGKNFVVFVSKDFSIFVFLCCYV